MGFRSATVPFALLAATVSGWAQGAPPGPADGQLPLADSVFSRVAPSIARIYWEEERNGPRATHGFFVGGGCFLSVRPEATLSEEASVRTAGDTRDARVVLIDPASGLVILQSANRLDDSLEALRLGTSRGLFVGDSVFAIRFHPEAGTPEATEVGIVLGRDRKVDGRPLEVGYLRIQLPGAVSIPGMPVFDHRGEVIGLDLGRELDDGGKEFHALPVEVAAKLVSDLKQFGRRVDAWIGLRFNTGTTTAKIVGVRPGSPGALCGVLPGDVVIHFAGARIDTIEDLSDSCYTLTPGRAAEIHVLRGVDRIERMLTPDLLTAKPDDSGAVVAP